MITIKARVATLKGRLGQEYYYTIGIRDYAHTEVHLQMPYSHYSILARELTGDEEPSHSCEEMKRFFQELVDKINLH